MFAASHHSSRIAGLSLAAWIALAAAVGFAAPVVIDVIGAGMPVRVAGANTDSPSPSRIAGPRQVAARQTSQPSPSTPTP